MVFKMKGFPMHSSASALKQVKDIKDKPPKTPLPPVELEDQFAREESNLANEAMNMLERLGYQDIDPNSPGYRRPWEETGEEEVEAVDVSRVEWPKDEANFPLWEQLQDGQITMEEYKTKLAEAERDEWKWSPHREEIRR